VTSGRRQRRTALLLAVAVVGAGLGVAIEATKVLKALENRSIDARFSVAGQDGMSDRVVVAGMELETQDRLKIKPPYPRRIHARAITALRRAGAKVITYDIAFDTQTTLLDDNALFDAIAQAGNVVLGTIAVFEGNETSALGGAANVRAAHARIGYAGFAGALDTTIRRVRATDTGVPTLAAASVSRAGGTIPAASRHGDGVLIDFRRHVDVIPFWHLLDRSIPTAKIRGKVVVVGDTDPTANPNQGRDVRNTSVGQLAGPEIQATAIDTLLRGAPLRDVTGGVGYPLLVLLGLVIPLGALRLHGLRWLPLAAIVLVGWPVAAQLLFNGGRVVPFVAGAIAVVVGALATLVVTYATELRQRRRMREQFAQFVPGPVVDAVAALADDDFQLPGVRLDATVLFCDLRGFTTTAERIGAERVIEMLNRYLTEMSDAILDQGGTVVSYMGDGVMAVFGAPLAQDDHADRALRAARSMLGPRLEAFNQWVRDQGLGDGFRLGVGLCSGPVMSGTVGSARSLDYATVGDTTNTAARLEAMTKETGHALHLADTTRMALVQPADDLVEIGELDVRGKQGRIRVWTLPVDASGPADAEVDGPAVSDGSKSD
jgi:adenylate cyclase